MAFLFAFVMLSSIGLPGLNGFVGEVMSLAGMAMYSPAVAAFGVLGTLLAAWYLLPAYQKVFWAPAGPGSVSEKVNDLDLRESSLLWLMAAMILAIGLYPAPLLALLEASL